MPFNNATICVLISSWQIEALEGKIKALTLSNKELQGTCDEYETEIQSLLEAAASLKATNEMTKMLSDQQVSQLRASSETHERELQGVISQLRSPGEMH